MCKKKHRELLTCFKSTGGFSQLTGELLGDSFLVIRKVYQRQNELKEKRISRRAEENSIFVIGAPLKELIPLQLVSEQEDWGVISLSELESCKDEPTD